MPSPRPAIAPRLALALAAALLPALASAQGQYPISGEQRSTAQQVAQAGVPLSELAANAPDAHTVQRGDTLWDISKLFLKSPWRWPELWGMNMEQIRNPHLIYPGQVLLLDKSGGRARLRLASAADGVPTNTVKLSPRVREQLLDNGAIASVPMHVIGPFLNEAVVIGAGELGASPLIVATQEGRVLLSRGETAYVRGDLQGARQFRVFREPKALVDPETRDVLGYEAVYVGTAEQTAEGREAAAGAAGFVPASFRISSTRLEAGVGDRLSPLPQRDLAAFAPRAPAAPVGGRVVATYGEALNAGQNQVVSINKGSRDGIERGHVLALYRSGVATLDATQTPKVEMKLPDEKHGLLFVFRTFERVSYALILSVRHPVRSGDRFSQP
jgi:hypothetical protein